MRTLTGLMVLATAVAVMPAAAANQFTTQKIMKQLSEQFRELELALDRGDSHEAAKYASALGSAAGALVQDYPTPDFLRHANRLGALSREVVQLAEAGAPDSLLAFEELRATCVQCHVSQRDDNALRGMFPARENVLSGTIELTDADGQAVDDRSFVLLFLERLDGPERLFPPPAVRRF